MAARVVRHVKQKTRNCEASVLADAVPLTRLVFLCCLATTPLVAYAQTPLASVRGTVSDAAGAVVVNAIVTVRDASTNDARSVVTGNDGVFFLTSLRPGPQRLDVAAPGYKRYVQPLNLRVGQEWRADVVLDVGAVTEEVHVIGDAHSIRRDTAGMGTVIDQRLIATVPLDGRNFLELTLLAAGSAPAAAGSPGTVRGDFAFTANGGREDANAFLLDGVENLDPKLNTPAVRPPVDAIREFEVRTSTHEATFGRQAGAQVNVLFKSGSNQLSGTGYEFYRGGLDARNYFAAREAPAPDYRRHQFGGTVGGPIVSNRTFFFGTFEATRRREGVTRITTVPTAAERTGDFSSSALPAPLNPFTGAPFPGARVPEAFMNPVGRRIAELYPQPNRPGPGGNFVSSPIEHDAVDAFDVRVTHAWSPSLRTAVRHSFGDRRLHEPFSGVGFAAVPGFGTDVDRRAQNLSVDLSHVLSPTLTYEARVGYTRVAAGAVQENQDRSLNRQVGLPEPWSTARDNGLSFISVSGFSPLGDEYNNPQHGTTNALQIADALTWSRGRHLVKFGGDVRLLGQHAFRDVQARGLLTFASVPYVTGNALADLLLGYPVLTGRARVDNPQHLRTTSYSAYVQDSLRLTSDVTLALGLRYEYQTPPTDPDDRATVYDQQTRSLVEVGTNGVPRGAHAPDRNNVAPRLGLTWALPDEGRTIARAGYGLYYNQSALAPSEGLYFSPPYYQFDFFIPAQGLPPVTVNDPFPASYPLVFPGSALSFQRDLKTPVMHQWNVGVQRALGRTMSLDLAYVGSRGEHLVRSRDINQADASPAPLNLRPDPRFADIVAVESQGRSRFRSLQVSLQRRQDAGLSALTSYVWSSSKDDASGFFSSTGDPSFPQDSNRPDAEWGRSAFDVRHRLTTSFAYAFPWGRDSTRQATTLLASGWQVAGVLTLQSGRPFTVALLPDIDNSNTGRAALGFGFNDRPNVSGSPKLDQPTAARWFNTGAFSLPAYGSFGNTGRNTVEGPGYANVNLALLKDLALAGRASLQLRVEAFNVLNRANFDPPDAFLGSQTFGQVLSAQPARRVQLGAKLLF